MQLVPTQLNRQQVEDLLEDYELRRAVVKQFGLLGFCLVYLSHYFYLDPAQFHRSLIEALENSSIDLLEVVGFRGSAKSVMASLALPLYLALEFPEDWPFIIPIADTGQQAALNIANIKTELEHNELLLQDYGQFKFSGTTEISPNIRKKKGDDDPTLESEEEWQAKNMLLSNGVRILARSRGQKIRGFRHRQFRPRVVIADDIDDLKSVRTKESRDGTERWWLGEVLPAMDQQKRKVVLVGNELHTDALMARMRKKKRFHYLEFPLVKDGECMWPAMYPTQKSLDDKRSELGEVAWMREMLLQVVPEEGAIIKPEDIHYYDKPPKDVALNATGLDYAISKRETADFTSGVSGGLLHEDDGRPHIDIYPNVLNARLDMQETISEMSTLQTIFGGNHIIFAEEVAYQKAANDEMERKGLPIQRMKPTTDKRARLRVVAVYIKNGTVRFPRIGCEDLIIQLLGFGIEAHDDMVDALVYLILGLVEQGLELEEIIAI